MSDTVVLLLDTARVVGVSSRKDETPWESPWNGIASAEFVRELENRFGEISQFVLVVGLGFLEIARPELPPLPVDAQIALLRRDADRYFPIDGSVAVAFVDGIGFAMTSAQLAAWVRSLEQIGRVVSCFALPALCTRALPNGEYSISTAGDDVSRIVVTDGQLRDVRRIARGDDSEPATRHSLKNTREFDVFRVLQSASRSQDAPASAQLLDDSLQSTFARRRATAILRSCAMLACAIALLAWSADRWRSREVQAMRTLVTTLRTNATAAQLAATRVALATSERRLLHSADSASTSGSGAHDVLARLGMIVPKDAFVTRLEWDGSAWRIDGSASDAARLVPLLDADSLFSEVRTVGASTRFLDAGKSRESFSIAFRTLPAVGGARGAP